MITDRVIFTVHIYTVYIHINIYCIMFISLSLPHVLQWVYKNHHAESTLPQLGMRPANKILKFYSDRSSKE